MEGKETETEKQIQKCKDKIKKWTVRLNAITAPASPCDRSTSTAGDYF